MRWFVLSVMACREKGEIPVVIVSTPTETTSPTLPSTFDSTPGTLLGASCAETDHPLRFLCTLDVSVPNAATWTVRDGGTFVRTFEAGARSHHEEILWGLPPETDLTWEVTTISGTVSGSFRTGALQGPVAGLQLQIDGAPFEATHLMVPYTCGGETGFALLGAADGLVYWYEPVEVLPPGSGVFAPSAGITAASWTESDDIVMVLDGMRAARLKPTGEWLYDVSGFSRPLHHDTAALGDYAYVINAYQEGNFVLDGLYVLDSAGEIVAEWDVESFLPPSGSGGGGFWGDVFPGASDFAHANGLSADGDSHLLLSLRLHDAVIRLAADPNDLSFGSTQWALTGNAASLVESDFAFTDGEGFEGQHHPSPLGGDTDSGGVAVFDNAPAGVDSRALFLDIDQSTGSVSVRESWPVGEHCSVQGGAYELPSGGVLATCNDSATIREFVPGSQDPVWTGRVSCATGPVGRIDRARRSAPRS